MRLTMKLWWSLWLLDLVHAAKVRPSVVTAPLNLLVQEPGLEASNHTLFNTLGDKESALALMNATGEHHSAMFIDGGDEGIMEHDMDEHGMDAMDDFHEDHETDHGMDEHYDDHYDEHYDHDSHDDMHFDPEENSLALASEKGMSYLNSSMNSTSAMGWRCRHGCRSCKRWNRNWCTSCHNGWRKYGHKCHPRHCDGKICKSCPGFWHRKQNNHCNSCHSGRALVGHNCKTEHEVHSGLSRRGDDKQASLDCPHGMWVKKCWVHGGSRHDGAIVSHDGRRCTAQSGHPHERVRAKAICSTTKTIAQDSGHHWRSGNVNVKCKHGDAIGCTCYTAAQAGDQMKELLQKISEGTLDPSTTTKLQEEMDRIRDRAQQMPGFMPGG